MILVFGDCQLDLDRRELQRAGEAVPTPPKVFDLLVYFVQNRDRVISRDELLEVVWHGRIVSDSTIASHVNAVRAAVGDNGHSQALLKTVPRKGFRFVGETEEAPVARDAANRPAAPGEPLPPPTPPDGPSIAVLPFVNLSGDPAQDYFADGLVEDIIGALSRFSGLFVIARNSTFTYKGRAVDVKQVGLDLGVRYVLEGNVRRADGRVRISGQLIDAATRGHLWADRFEGSVDSLFDLQDQLTESLVGALSPQLERAEIVRSTRKPTAILDSYDYYLRGMECFHKGTREANATAISMFYGAIERDPDYAAAYAMAAWCLFWRRVCGWATDAAAETAEGTRLAHLAVELGRNDAIALTRAGHALVHFGGDLATSIELLERARTLNPNLAATAFLGGYVHLWHGESDKAIEGFQRAIRLSPLDPEMYRMQVGMAMAHLQAGRYDAALIWAERASINYPDIIFVALVAASSLALCGRTNDGRATIRRLLQLHPTLSISKFMGTLPVLQPTHFAGFLAGLREAGLPE